jgi:predicted amidohydrolase YtcJ
MMRKLFTNATFHLMTGREDIANSLLVEDSRIIQKFCTSYPVISDCELIDLKGSHVYPGFIDTHTHSFEGGLYSQSLDLSKVLTLKQTLELIDEYYMKGKAVKASQLDAFRFDENKIDEKRFPTMNELDRVCPDIPLILRRIDGHSSVTNSSAWKIFCNASQQSSSSNAHAFIAGLTGKVNDNFVLRGELNDKLVHWFHENCSEQIILDAYACASKIALSNGITTVHTMVGDAQNSIMHFRFLRDNLSEFNVEFILYPQSFNIKAALDEGASRIGGCILADGSLGSYTASLSQHYVGKPDEFGLLYHDDSYWEEFVSEAIKHNLQVAIHCIGDKAIKQINDIYRDFPRIVDNNLRCQLIHCELTPDDLIDEIAISGAIPVMQPAFDLYWGYNNGFYEKVLGPTRKNQMNRFRALKDRGIITTGGSDWYVTELDALQGIRAAMNHNNSAERLDWFDAIKMYTVNAAFLSHDENRLGMLKEGYDADFVCLDHDISAKSHDEINQVRTTYKQGRLVFGK